MRILVVGRGSGGSWEIRGRQLGEAIGGTVDPNPAKLKGYDLAIVVKRPRADPLARLHAHGMPVVWDSVDAWPQPHGNEWDKTTCCNWLADELCRIKPSGIVFPTRTMQDDYDFNERVLPDVPSLVLPHHARPDQKLNPIREKVQAVGYQGGLQYLGFWQRWLEVECAARGWRFVLNPEHLADLDIVVAVRAQTGYAARNWKSNVKLANAQGSATPIVCGREAGYLEWSRGIRWADSTTDMTAALDELADVGVRRKLSRELLEGTPTLENVAERYRDWLERLPIATVQAA